MTLDELNRLTTHEAWGVFQRCCGASVGVERMCAERPYRDRAALDDAAERAAAVLEPSDWREAFEHHPRIGDLEALRERFAATAQWAGDEQAGAASAPDATLEALARGNREYEEKFGHIFIVCATGKSAGEMLLTLHDRMLNDSDTELRAAAAEQMKITRLRLDKLLGESPTRSPAG